MAAPPDRTVTPGRSWASCSDSASAYFCASFSPPVMPATTRPAVLSLLTSSAAAGGGAVHAEVTCATCGDCSSALTISVPVAVAAGLFTPSSAVTVKSSCMSP